jgi:hypothetical protein
MKEGFVRFHASAVAAAFVLASVAAACGAGTSVAKGDLPIHDDFSGDCGWATDDNGGASVGCAGGGYRILVKRPSINYHQVIPTRFAPVQHLVIESDATLAALRPLGERDYAYYGLGCWSTGAGKLNRGYVFVVKPDGSAGVLRADESDPALKRLFYLKDVLGVPANPAFAGVGHTLRIHAECDSTRSTARLIMNVNGKQVVSATDDAGFGPLQAAGFDVFTTVPGMDVRYDNVDIHQ